MAETATSPIWQVMAAQSSGMSPEQYKAYLQAQQQEAMASALMQQGATPLDTSNRQIGGVGYKISPVEGLAKLADVLSGKYQQNNANSNLANAIMPQGGSGSSSAYAGDPIVQAMPPQTQMMFNRLMLPEAAGGNPRAGMELYNTYASGMKSYGAKTGENAAGLAPANALPAGVATPQITQQPPPIPQQPQGGQMGTPPPPVPVQGPQNLPPIGGTPDPQQAAALAAYRQQNGMATPPPPVPVQGPQNLPPIGGTPDPQQAAALAAYRQQNGMATPPIDNQRAAAGLPVGVGSNLPQGASMTQGIPQVPASPPSASLAMPTPQPGESFAAYQARLKAAESGATSEAADTGTNLADATKTYNVAASNLPRAMQRFKEVRDAAAIASSGGGVSDQEPEQGLFEHFLPGPDYARSWARTSVGGALDNFVQGGNVANANATITRATQQGILSELGPQLEGLRGNKFLESIASGASGLNPADPSDTKISAVNGLQDQYISNMVSLANQRRAYGDPQAPTHLSMAQLIAQNADPTYEVHIAHPDGSLGTIKARSLVPAVQAGATIQ
jgi:hypothetical protein